MEGSDPMNIVIVEDEARSARRLKRLIRNEFDSENLDISESMTIDSALVILDNKDIDLLFLDLNLQGNDGFEILQNVVAKSFHTIIVSAYAERAIEAFEYGVLDFVPKPVDEARLQQAINRFKSEKLTDSKTKYLTVKKSGLLEKIEVDEILYLHSESHYTELHFNGKPVKLHDKPLEKLLMILPNQFKRSHRSYIVNMTYVHSIHSYEGSKYEIELNNKEIIPLSRTHVKEIKEVMQNFGKS